MSSLELKIPPPLVAVFLRWACGASRWLHRHYQCLPRFAWLVARYSSLPACSSAPPGIVSFRRARTTINPTKPENTSSLVSSGALRITRNPMYVGLSLVLVAWVIFLSSVWALVGPIAFVLYIKRFQITPEERALAKLFGSEYDAYRGRVRRWL